VILCSACKVAFSVKSPPEVAGTRASYRKSRFPGCGPRCDIGFSFGAWIAGIVAAVDARMKRAVLIAGAPRMSEFWRASQHPDVVRIRQGLQPGIMDHYAEATKRLDATEYLQRCSSIPLLFQFGAGDEVISQEYVGEFTPYASGSNQLKVYESGSHYQMFLNPDARRDRLSWIRDELAQGQ